MKQYLLLLTLLLLLILPVVAEGTTVEGGYAIVTYENTTVALNPYAITPPPSYPPTPHYRLPSQGADVYVNDTVDLFGSGWAEGVAWYGHWGEYTNPKYIREFTGYKDEKNFYIDPAIFEDKWGMWYQYYGNASERNGNLALFFVKAGKRSVTTTYPNGTVLNATIGINNASTGYVKPVVKVLPDVRVSDYNLARGDSFDTGFGRIWVFGRTVGYYAHSGTLNVSEVNAMEPGTYKLAQQTAGANGIMEVNYDAENYLLFSPWKSVPNVSVYGSQPLLDIDKVTAMIAKSDDILTFYSLEVSMPSITIDSIDEVDVGSRIPVVYTPGMTLLDIRGYTNVAANSTLSFILDPDKQTPRTIKSNTYKTSAKRTDPGLMGTYQVYIPVNKNDMPNGMHTVLATSAIGASMKYDFPVNELPADSYAPNMTSYGRLKYIGDENPWKPNLTIPEPIIITQTPIIVEKVVEITIPVTPSQESLDQAAWNAATGWIILGTIVTITAAFILYLFAAFIRGLRRTR